MVELGNNIKVLLTKYNNNVIIDDIGGELLLYNHSGLLNIDKEPLLKDYVFTGVKLEYFNKVVDIIIKDFYEKSLKYVINNGFIFVEQTSDMFLNDPICVVSFVAKATSFVRGQFYAHFIEKDI